MPFFHIRFIAQCRTRDVLKHGNVKGYCTLAYKQFITELQVTYQVNGRTEFLGSPSIKNYWGDKDEIWQN